MKEKAETVSSPLVLGACETQLVNATWKGTEEENEAFGQTSKHNLQRIQEFLDVPLKEIGDATENVRLSLAARGVQLRTERTKSTLPLINETVKTMRKVNGYERELGIRSRFSDGDGTFWDRWINTTGCLDGQGNYLFPTAPVRSGNEISPNRFFNHPQLESPEQNTTEANEYNRSLKSESALSILLNRYKEEKVNNNSSDDYVDHNFRNSVSYFRAAMPFDHTNAQVSAMLEKLDLTTRIDEVGRRHVALPSQGLTPKQTAALAECLKFCALPVHSLDLSGNPALGSNLQVLLQGIEATSSHSLAALDLSRVQLYSSSIHALAMSLSSGSIAALHTLCMASVGINDKLMAILAKALRKKNAPSLRALDVSINAIGSSLDTFGVSNSDIKDNETDDLLNARYLAAVQGGPLGALLEISKAKKLDDEDYHQGQSSLLVLNASRNLMRGDVTIGLARVVARHPNLTQLHLARNRFGDSGCVELASAISNSANLTFLDVSGNEIRLKGAACLSAAIYKMPRLNRLLIGDNPIGAAGASLLLPLKFSSKNDYNSQNDGISFADCELTTHDECDFDVDWLFGVPLLRLSAEHIQFQRAPWRYRFKMDSALDQALAQGVLRITAASTGVFQYDSCSVRHTAEFNREILKVARRRAENAKASGKAWSQKVAKMLLHMSVKPERKKNLKKMTDAMAFIGDVHSRFLKLERVTNNSSSTSSSENMHALSNKKGPHSLTALNECKNDKECRASNLEIMAAELLLKDRTPRRRRASIPPISSPGPKVPKRLLSKNEALELLKSIDANCNTSDVERAFALYDWNNDGIITRQRFLQYVRSELASYVRRQNDNSTFESYWTATFESEMKSRWEGIAREPEAAKKGGLFSSSEATARIKRRQISDEEDDTANTKQPWTLPSEGVVELRFNLSASPPVWERCQISANLVGRILLTVDEMGGQVHGVLRAVRLAGIRFRIDEAVALSLALIARHTEEHGHREDAQVHVLTAVLPIVTGSQHARCTRDIIINANLSCNGKGVEACRKLRRAMGFALYQAALGVHAGHYELDLRDTRDREALRLLIEADSAGSVLDIEQKVADISQRGKRGRFRNICIDDEACPSTGGIRSHVDPKAIHFGSENCFAAGQTVFAIHGFFDCDSQRPEKRLLPTDAGTRTRGKFVFDFAPPQSSNMILY